jgi:multidrug efflux pump subunit AcrB
VAWQQNRATRNNVFGLLLPQAGIPSISGPQLDNSSLESAWGSADSLLLSWEPFDFGLRKANVELAWAIGRQASANEAVTKLDVSAAAADAFLTLLAADQTLEAAQAGVERAETLARAVRALVANQLRPGIEDVRSIPVNASNGARALAGDVAEISFGTAVGEYDRHNQQRMITITGNVAGADLGSAARETQAAIARAGEAPRGARVDMRGQVPPMRQAQSGLQFGLLPAIAVIFLLLVANFQSLRASLAILSMIPAVVMGVAVALWVTGTTLNVQSFTGAIMAVGVSVANAILLVTFAEQRRREGQEANAAAMVAASSRLRPILMTSFAMIAGMTPMALGIGEGGEQTAPLGRAVIGGLAASTIAVLTALPLVFAIAQRKASRASASLHPEDEVAAH